VEQHGVEIHERAFLPRVHDVARLFAPVAERGPTKRRETAGRCTAAPVEFERPSTQVFEFSGIRTRDERFARATIRARDLLIVFAVRGLGLGDTLREAGVVAERMG
jgi:hypothetical protein